MDTTIISEKKGRGRGDSKPVPKQSVLKLSKRQKELIRSTALAVSGQKNQTQAAAALGITRQAMGKRIQTYPQIMEEVDKMRKLTVEFARNRVLSASEDSADKLVSLMEANSENVQLQASIEILDRAGIVKPQTQNNIQVNVLNQLNKDRGEYDL